MRPRSPGAVALVRGRRRHEEQVGTIALESFSAAITGQKSCAKWMRRGGGAVYSGSWGFVRGGVRRIMKRLLICTGLCWACATEPAPTRAVELSSPRAPAAEALRPPAVAVMELAPSAGEPSAEGSPEEPGTDLDLAAPPHPRPI